MKSSFSRLRLILLVWPFLMAVHPVSAQDYVAVRISLPAGTTHNSESLFLSSEQLQALPRGVVVGDQVRLSSAKTGQFAAFTIESTRDLKLDGGAVGLVTAAMARIPINEGEKVRISVPLVKVTIDDDDAFELGEMHEFVLPADIDGRRFKLLILAPHGGLIEQYSDRIATELRSRQGLGDSAVLWACVGYGGKTGAYKRWHITSTKISERSFPLLGRIVAHQNIFDYAISLHGYGGERILIGGNAPHDLKESIKTAIELVLPDCRVLITSEGDKFSGMSPRNIVNRYSKNGVQLELPLVVRQDERDGLLQALEQVYGQLLHEPSSDD